MKAQIGAENDSGIVHTVRCTSDNDHDVTQVHRLLHCYEKTRWSDAKCQGVARRPGSEPNVSWRVAMHPSKCKAIKQADEMGELLDKAEKLKQCVRAMVVHPVWLIQR